MKDTDKAKVTVVISPFALSVKDACVMYVWSISVHAIMYMYK
jgi:hypothetical protein